MQLDMNEMIMDAQINAHLDGSSDVSSYLIDILEAKRKLTISATQFGQLSAAIRFEKGIVDNITIGEIEWDIVTDAAFDAEADSHLKHLDFHCIDEDEIAALAHDLA